jgi:hypothetical protein
MQDEGAQIHMARLNAIADKGGRGGKLDGGLGDVILRIGFDLFGKSLALLVKELLLRQAHRLLAPVEVELTSSARVADVPLSMRTVLRHKEHHCGTGDGRASLLPGRVQ